MIDSNKILSLKFNLYDYLKIISNECNTKDELFDVTLKELSKMNGLKSSMLYILNESSYDYDLIKVEPELFQKNAVEVFDILIYKNVFTKLFSNDEPIDLFDKKYGNIYVFPLKKDSILYGLIILNFNSKTTLKDELKEQIKLFIAVFNACNTSKYINKNEVNSNVNNKYLSLQETIKNLQIILNSISEGIIVTDSNNSIVDTNLFASSLLGLSKEELLGKNLNEFFLFFDKGIFKDEIINNEEALLIKNDGSPIPIIYKNHKIILDKITYNLLTIIDITDRKLMEDKILEAKFELENKVKQRTKELYETNIKLKEEILRKEKAEKENLRLISAINQSYSLIFILDTDLKIIYVNKAVIKKTKYNEEELIGKNIFSLNIIDNINDINSITNKNLNKESYFSLELESVSKLDEKFWVSAYFTPVKNSNGEIINYICIQEDITDLKNYQHELILAKEKVEKSLKAKTVLLNKISHEFRTPLISVLGFSEILETEIRNKDHLEMINGIKEGGKRLLNSLDSVLLLSELESSDVQLNIKSINIVPVINSILILFESLAHFKNIDIINEIKFNKLFAKVDEDYFRVMIHQLIDNAIKFTKHGKVIVSVSLIEEENCNKAKISIKDTGIGIEKNKIDNLFTAFKQLSEGLNRNYDGFGLGLTLVKKISELMNCDIEVESDLNIGSTFSIIIDKA